MKQQEFMTIAALIKTSYPANNVLPTKETVNTWYEMLKDLDYGICINAVKDYIKNNDYPPTIAGIRKGCVKKENILANTWDVAWDKVMTAVRKYGTYGASEAMSSLDDLTRKAVKAISYYEICTSPNTSYLRNEFKSIYDEYKKDQDSKTQANTCICTEGAKLIE